MSVKASANDLIGVRVNGYVNGSVTQKATHGGHTNLYIGSVVSNGNRHAVRNIDVNAVYEGDIYLESRAKTVTLSIGSYVRQ